MTMSRKTLIRSKKTTNPLDIKILINNKEDKKKRVYRRKKNLPHDLIMEQILTKVSVPTLVRCGAVSKLWYRSIHKEKHLASSHFLHSKNNAKLGFTLLNVKEHDSSSNRNSSMMGNHFFTIDDDKKYLRKWFKVDFLTYFLVATLRNNGRKEKLVGYCNGFTCVATMGSPCYKAEYAILNPHRLETLYIFSPGYIFNSSIVSHGFGYDSVRNEYKVVTIYYDGDDIISGNFKCIVFTLGTKSWRQVATINPALSGGGHVNYGPANVQIRAVKHSDKAAVFCANDSGDNLFWKIMVTNRGGGHHDEPNNNNVNTSMEMVLAFDLRKEKFQFIQLPPLPSTSKIEQQKLSVVDYHQLLEYKGSLCVARIEKSLEMTSYCYHRRHHYHYQSTSNSSGSCCCCSKVQLHVLKDKFKQVWVTEDTFDVHILKPPFTSSVFSDDPCCFCLNSTTTTPPTRVMSFSDQVFLYWFYVDYLQVYNLRTKQFKVVSLVTRSSDIKKIFHNKMKEASGSVHSGGDDDEDGDDDDIYCSSMDYQLHAQVQNFLSLQTFLPEGVVTKFDKDAFEKLDMEKEERPYSAYLRIIRKSAEYYPF